MLLSLLRGADYQQNLNEPAWRDTALGSLARSAMDKGQTEIGDLAVNAPGSEPSQFLAAPIFDEGELRMLLVLELPLSELNRVMQTRQGLGEAGETYLVGDDARLRSDSARFSRSDFGVSGVVVGARVRPSGGIEGSRKYGAQSSSKSYFCHRRSMTWRPT